MSDIGAQPVNRTLYHGDNLLVLRGINANAIDLIATDPPFNKGRDFHATPDSLASGASFQDRWSWDDDVDGAWVDKLQDDFPDVYHVVQGSRKSYGDDMGAFLCFMAVRLLEMRRILKPNGSIYLHCDPTASHYLKELMDAIFGRSNFKNEIIWHYNKWTNAAKMFQKNHDVILYYVKSSEYTFNKLEGEMTKRQKQLQEIGYNLGSNKGKKLARIYDESKCADKIEKWKAEGRTIYYVEQSTGNSLPDVWNISILNGQSKERTGHPTQKPLELYKRIIEASSNPGDVVLDPFCGCATTCVSAELLGRQWIGIDLWKKAHDVVWDRFKDECDLITPDGKVKGLGILVPDGRMNYQTTPPKNTDEDKEALPLLPSKNVKYEPETPGERMSKHEMKQTLLQQNGNLCEGCNRRFDDERYLELDHKNPRSNGGANSLYNRILLCSPCNKKKSNKITLVELIRQNKKEGFWKGV